MFDIQAIPTSEWDSAQIRGSFRVIDLNSEGLPHFAALSYVWGTANGNVHKISCDGSDLDILPDCHSALQHLRRKLGAFNIWVDAICIGKTCSRFERCDH